MSPLSVSVEAGGGPGDPRVSVRCRTQLDWQGPRRFGPASEPTRLRFEGLVVGDEQNRVGDQVELTAGSLEWCYEVVLPAATDPVVFTQAGRFGSVGYGVLGSLLLVPQPWPERRGSIQVSTGPGVCSPIPADDLMRIDPSDLSRTIVLVGPFAERHGVLVGQNGLAIDAQSLQSIGSAARSLESLLSQAPIARPAVVVVPLEADDNDGRGIAGLAGTACALVFTPVPETDGEVAHLAWVAAHELAHQWVGCRLRPSSEGLDWFFEGIPSYLATIAVREALSLPPAYEYNLVAMSRRARSVASGTARAMHEGMLAAFLLDGRIRDEDPGRVAGLVVALCRSERRRAIGYDDLAPLLRSDDGLSLHEVFADPTSVEPQLRPETVQAVDEFLARHAAGAASTKKTDSAAQ